MLMIADIDIVLLRTFVAIVETNGLTSAGKKVGRTQPAITHQIKRLEENLGRPLFGRDRRNLTLTRDGEIFLGYARNLLRINDEIRARFSAPMIEGHVKLGMPDLYAPYLLPGILGSFARAHPGIQVELMCTRSVHLHAALQREEIDIALMTNQPEFRGGDTVRLEKLVWVTGPMTELEIEEPLPLALMPPGSVLRQRALESLDRLGRKWLITSVCDSVAGLRASVLAGLAISVFPECAVTSELRILGKAEGLPNLPSIEIVLYRSAKRISAVAEHLAQYIAAEFAQVEVYPGIELSRRF
jgi:DNA-binding transcriptional LysR family regulator